jgi:AcrR family transcriptional regulator
VSTETSKPVRRPGRPAGPAASKDQRERLLDIALELFARHGVADTTLSAIARKAGMTPAMAHYYFKTREQLFDLLIDERIMPARANIEEVFQAHPTDPVKALSLIAERLVATNARLPWFGALWIREMISDNDIFKQHMRRTPGSDVRKRQALAGRRQAQSGHRAGAAVCVIAWSDYAADGGRASMEGRCSRGAYRCAGHCAACGGDVDAWDQPGAGVILRCRGRD